MRLGNLVGIAAMISGSLAACSTPASNHGRAARDIDLPAPPASDGAVLSTIEAGKAVPLSPVHQTAHRASATASAAMAHRMEVAVPKALAMPGSSTLNLVSASEQVPTAPQPAAQSEADAQSATSEGGYTGMGAYRGHEPPRRDPVIIIRGGLGGIDDRCDLRPRGGRGGIMINHMAPPMGGGGIR
jgi:hypothetical protein